MHATRLTPRLIMWVAIGLSVALGGILIALGWASGDAWATAAAVMLLACVAVCVWGAVQGRRAEREVDRVIARLVESRRVQQTRSRDP